MSAILLAIMLIFIASEIVKDFLPKKLQSSRPPWADRFEARDRRLDSELRRLRERK